MEEATSPEELSKKAEEAPTEVKETASAAVHQARSTVQAAWQETKNKINVLETYIREHPTRAVLLALGMGFILALLTRK